jgi:arylsulfatase A-like enzyme
VLPGQGKYFNPVFHVKGAGAWTSDQGFMLGQHDYIDKRWMYEPSLRVPLIVRFPPKVVAGSTSDALVNNTDFAPTLLALAGVDRPASMQGPRPEPS